jgi:hypothetical protein
MQSRRILLVHRLLVVPPGLSDVVMAACLFGSACRSVIALPRATPRVIWPAASKSGGWCDGQAD